MSSKDIFALRKQGRTLEALEMARTEYDKLRGESNQAVDDIWLLRAYAWSLYDQVKHVVDAYEVKQLSPTSMSERMSPLMREFSKMAKLLRGDSAFSQMVRLAGKVSKDWHDFLGFAKWAGIGDFSVEDKASYVNEQGKSVDSLKTRFIRAICRETVTRATDPQTDKRLIIWGRELLDQALQEAPNDQWLNYYQSKLHLANGESDQAIKRLASVLRRQSRAAWTWALLGEILESTRPDDAITCFAYATQLAREEQEVAKVRIHLAVNLSLIGRFNEAAKQAFLALQFREQHGFKVPQELRQLLESDWYQQVISNQSMVDLLSAEAAAQALMQEINRYNLSYTTGVVDHINVDKALSYVATGVNAGLAVPHRKFPKIAPLPPGTLVEVGRSEADGPVLDWRLSAAQSLPGLCEVLSGTLMRQEDKSFAFVNTVKGGVFVPPELAADFMPEQDYPVTVLAIRRTNKQGKTGWRTVKFIDQVGQCPSGL